MAKPKSLSLLDLFISPQEIRDWKGGFKLIRNVGELRQPALGHSGRVGSCVFVVQFCVSMYLRLVELCFVKATVSLTPFYYVKGRCAEAFCFLFYRTSSSDSWSQ